MTTQPDIKLAIDTPQGRAWYVADSYATHGMPLYDLNGQMLRVEQLPRTLLPYYTAPGITLYHGDARGILPLLCPVDCIITDPVWPNVPAGLLAGSDDPYGLFAAAAAHFPRLAQRAVIQLGCDSDPRFLRAIPVELPFLRVCWLEYAVPGYKGRLLYTGDVAYAYGTWPASKAGARVIPGRCIQAKPEPRGVHPTPRGIGHVRWLVKWFADGTVLDPFCGSGQTALACRDAGIPFVGIEIEQRYLDETIRKLEAQTSYMPALVLDEVA
jgi:site-specific DNA-methyltransferase (adenine-specific)